ncbi:MAG: hypothetical protein ACI86X_001763 [Moritella sp.]|jgi:hypothetical protein
MINIYRVTFPDGSVYITAKKKPPADAAASYEWAKNHEDPTRPLVAAYLKSKGQGLLEVLHSDLTPDMAKKLKRRHIVESRQAKLYVIS